MDTITTQAVITEDHQLNLNIHLPETYPIGETQVTLIFKPKANINNHVNRLAEIGGKGKVWISEDFDAPLEDFKEYM